MIDSKNSNDDIVARYFDEVQNEIKKLISQDKEIKPKEVEKFNNEIFNQPEEIQNQIRQYIDKATMHNLDIKKVAKIIYDKFKLQIKNNVFNQDDVNDVPNKLVGEKRHIKTFEQFMNEGSYFHTMKNIDEILDKISKSGYESLDDSDKAILLNFSKDDEDIYDILVKLNNLIKKFKRLNQKISVLVGSDSQEVEKVKKDWLTINSELADYESKLRYLYKIEDPQRLWDYAEQQGLTSENKKNDENI